MKIEIDNLSEMAPGKALEVHVRILVGSLHIQDDLQTSDVIIQAGNTNDWLTGIEHDGNACYCDAGILYDDVIDGTAEGTNDKDLGGWPFLMHWMHDGKYDEEDIFVCATCE